MSYVSDLIDSLTSCLTCFQSPALRINNRKFKILKLLGEGGFSYVYLVQDTRTDQLFALKKIRCPFGQESIQAAIREIDAYNLFKSDYIIRAIDSSVVQEKEGSKTVYILLPYFEKGNLQDRINDNLIGGTSFNEDELIRLIIDICKGIRVMHNNHGAGSNITSGREGLLERMDMTRNRGNSNIINEENAYVVGNDDDEEDEQDYDNNHDHNLDHNDGSSSPHESRALLLEQEQEQAEADADADDINDISGSTPLSEIIPYAHRDIKPANIMIHHITGKPVLMDLGSCSRARVHLRTRQQALELQDLAAEHCTLPYRAPELFDVKTGSSIDERVDIWSLGCTIFALMYSASPFELQTSETGASLNMAIINGQYKFPTTPEYCDGLKDLVKLCLTVSPDNRPFIDEVLGSAQALL